MLADCSGPIDNYSSGTTATWLLDPSSIGNAVENFTITGNEMDLAAGDYLRVYDGENDSAPLLLEYTGTDILQPKTSTGGKVFVKFTSTTGSATGKGFLITYEAKLKKYCDPNNPVVLTAPSGIFTDGSPEDMNYPNGSGSCRWDIFPAGAVDPETEITFDFKRLDTEENVDVIKFYNAETSNLLASVSGTYDDPTTLPQLVHQAKQITIFFSSSAYVNGKGFEIVYFTLVNIKEIENINDLSIYPNPASDKVNVKFNTSTADNFDITIYNVTGQTVYKETLPNFMGSYHNELNIADFAQGVYLMQIKSSKGAITRKVVIQ
jgi:hypothetical protein